MRRLAEVNARSVVGGRLRGLVGEFDPAAPNVSHRPALVSPLIRHLSSTALGVFGYDFARVRRVSPVGHQTLFGSTPWPVNNGGVR